MQNTLQLLELFLTWPTVAILALLFLRKPLTLLLKRIIESHTAKAKIGFIELELGELTKRGKAAVDTLNDLSIAMGKTRLLELEVTKEHFSMSFSHEQRNRLDSLILELQDKINYLEKEYQNEILPVKK